MCRVIVALIILLLLPTIILHPANVGEETVCVIVSDLPLVKRAELKGISLHEAEDLFEEGLRMEVEDALFKLKALRIPYKPIEILTHVLHGAIIKVPKTHIHTIKSTHIFQSLMVDQQLQISIKRSVEWIGAAKAHTIRDRRGTPLTGRGIVIAVIDTGVDYNHPDLKGKVIGGYDFIDEDEDPMDPDGHGTHIAGIIAANGSVVGVAPEASILAYRVVAPGGHVSGLAVVRALERAVKEGARVINISFGIRSESELVREAILNAVKSGVVVVAAAGNFGPRMNSISMPASYYHVVCVGSSLNNNSESVAAAIDVEGFSPRAYPLIGSALAPEGVVGRLVYVKYARKRDVAGLNLTGMIALAERGGEFGELVYFSTKEANVADRGAIGLIIYNNVPGIMQGSLIGPHNPPNYKPRIPTVFISRADGLRLLQLMKRRSVVAKLKVYVEPDTIAIYSSRGYPSPFYIKPDLVAPGFLINSTAPHNSYRVLSGTSFAAPHVSGAAALLLQQYPDLNPYGVASILSTTSSPVVDAWGNLLPAYEQGSGRVDVLSAISSPLIIKPYQLIIHLAEHQRFGSRAITLTPLDWQNHSVAVDSYWPYPEFINLTVSPHNLTVARGGSYINVSAMLLSAHPGMYEGRLLLHLDGSKLNFTLPMLIYVNNASLRVLRVGGVYRAMVVERNWRFASVAIEGPGLERVVKRLKSPNDTITIPVTKPGEYWIEAKARTYGGGRIVGRTILDITTPIDGVAEESGHKVVVDNYIREVVKLLVFSSPAIIFVALILLHTYIVRRRESPQLQSSLRRCCA